VPEQIITQIKSRAECPYCRNSLLQTIEVAECSICKTAHHIGCWLENGRCSVFGCNGSYFNSHIFYHGRSWIHFFYYGGIICIAALAFAVAMLTDINMTAPLLMLIAWGLWVAFFGHFCRLFVVCPQCSEKLTLERDGLRMNMPESCPACGTQFL
jgi:Prokaryotic RING finger family 1